VAWGVLGEFPNFGLRGRWVDSVVWLHRDAVGDAFHTFVRMPTSAVHGVNEMGCTGQLCGHRPPTEWLGTRPEAA
jgi:hypothetical protein